MEQSGEYRIAAPREQVWAALNDPDILGKCIAGCQKVSRTDDQHFDVKVKAKVGPVSAVFDAALELSELQPPQSYVIVGNVKGGAAGFAKGSATVTLREETVDEETSGEAALSEEKRSVEAGTATVLSYVVNANVGGKLAQVGSRLVDGAARKMADDFFAAFSALLNPVAEDAPPDNQRQSDAAAETAEGSAASGQWKIWLIAFVVLGLAAVLTT
ncbi:MAG: carbon monoxide dehydrogenase subunit G [Pseudomonadota bacterium]